MRLLLAILFSVVLVGAQSVPTASAQVASAAARHAGCKCRHCGDDCCCVKKSVPRSDSAPIAPAQRVAQPGQLLLIAPTAVAFVLPRTASVDLAQSLSHPSRAAALPLYQQNCTFLI